jgi:HSP20 family protein
MSLIRFKNSALPSLVENFFNREANEFFEPFGGASLPSVNILEKEEGFEIELAAPGLKKEQFQIQLNQNILSISFQKEEEHQEQKGRYTRREFRTNSFKRSFTLPQTIDAGQISATYVDGILHLHLPKKEEAKVKTERLIEIQ